MQAKASKCQKVATDKPDAKPAPNESVHTGFDDDTAVEEAEEEAPVQEDAVLEPSSTTAGLDVD